ncbi:MAG: hypothetical protein ACE5Z5_00905 [Candidatus Bathyarchaeia archaeon]
MDRGGKLIGSACERLYQFQHGEGAVGEYPCIKRRAEARGKKPTD